MKSYSIKTQIGILAAAFCLLFSGCALEDEWYSETTPDTFFRNKGDVYKVLNRPSPTCSGTTSDSVRRDAGTCRR